MITPKVLERVSLTFFRVLDLNTLKGYYMELHLATGSIVVTGSSLMVGDENSHAPRECVFLKDVSRLQDRRIQQKLTQLQEQLEDGLQELLKMAIEAYECDPSVEGCMIEGEDVA